MEKRRNCSLRAISSLFHNILSVVRFSYLKGTRFSLRDKRLFEVSEVEITRVDCIIKLVFLVKAYHQLNTKLNGSHSGMLKKRFKIPLNS